LLALYVSPFVFLFDKSKERLTDGVLVDIRENVHFISASINIEETFKLYEGVVCSG